MYRSLIPWCLALGGALLSAQVPMLQVPQASPRATISQTVGMTELSVAYARPAVQGRKIWGGLVPYGKVWRAGANENTVVTFSSPVKAGGVALPAGSYGLHMVPTETDWTVVFSSQSHAWGSFSYDPKEDVARIVVKPVPGEATEQLAYTFDELSGQGVTLSLRWEKLQVPIRFEVDTKAVTVASLRQQLRGLQQFFPECWNAAARWCAQNDVNFPEALAWVDRSLAMKETFGGLRVKALLMEKTGDAAAAASLRAKAMAIATEVDVNAVGYQLLGQGKTEEAIATFQTNVKAHPESWNTYDSLAEAYRTAGDKAKAVANYRKALELVKAEDQRARITEELARLK